jgi:Xaa-Pro aminopeptidase
MDMKQKLSALRARMAEAGLGAYVQPVHDEYLSEYPPACNQRVAWLCGFTGSAGMLAVTATQAVLFTDGRYTLQAQAELDSAQFAAFNSAEKKPEEWLGEQATKRIGYDPKLFTDAMLRRMQKPLEKQGAQLVACENLVDAIWQGRPGAPATPLFAQPLALAGESSPEKRARIGRAIAAQGAELAVIVAPDSLCWLLNVRAHDVECSPFVLAPMLVHADGRVELFLDVARAQNVLTHWGEGVALLAPDALAARLAELGRAQARVLIDPNSLPVWYVQALAGAHVIEGAEPCQLPKAMKNPAELAAIREVHRRDGVAVARLMCWLEDETKKRSITEMEVADQLLAFRKQVEGFVEPSFPTIAGSGPNGAIVHYRANEKTNRALQLGELFLLDSGGQYAGGTTDITRTVAIGSPTPEQKDRFTRVLKGHIAIATAQFPKGTNGSQLDSLARQYLWQAALDYDHGTGHGVGQFLCVHEGPQRISKRGGDVALAAGMVLSNEPGYYKTGEYGIRIENLVVVCEAGHGWLRFETLTCVPIDLSLVDASLLTADERMWLNHYHEWVLRELAPQLSGAQADWLHSACRALA